MIYKIWLQTWAPETWMRDVGIEGRWWLLTSMLQSNRLLSESLGPSHNVTYLRTVKNANQIHCNDVPPMWSRMAILMWNFT